MPHQGEKGSSYKSTPGHKKPKSTPVTKNPKSKPGNKKK
ncbi:hypothetical protein LCGC14_1425080 [marine sediment metagenome]|uniref:Uncharacterized protein n=1 Tax=marine sediment metagenome TaxID=412755 RepID=A0A0F9M5Q1_9ZZZZ